MKRIEITFTKDGWHRVEVAPHQAPGYAPVFCFKQDGDAHWAQVKVWTDQPDAEPLFDSIRTTDRYPLDQDLQVTYPSSGPAATFYFAPLLEGQTDPPPTEPPSVGTVKVP